MLDDFIFGMHAAIILIGLIIPFIGDRKLLKIYSFMIPFLLFHWAINDDTCFLTQLECFVSDRPKDRTFVGRLIGPIYNVPDSVIGKLIKSIFFCLWILVQWKLEGFRVY